MILNSIQEVFVAQHRVDFRQGVFGMVAQMMQMDLNPYAGDCCVFIHPSHRQLRIVGGASTGCWMAIKIFEAGALQQKMSFLVEPSFVQISKLELEMLFEGTTYTLVSKVPDWQPCVTGRSNVKSQIYEKAKEQKTSKPAQAS